MRDQGRRASALLFLAALVSVFALLTATSATAETKWEGGQVNCRPDQQVRLAVSFRGVLHIEWSEDGGARHTAGPYYNWLYGTVTYDTGAPVVSWRAEAEKADDAGPADINDAYATCV